MTASWQVEHLFATPMVALTLPASLDPRSLEAARVESGAWPAAVSSNAAPIVQYLRSYVDRMTAGPNGQAAVPAWYVHRDAVHLPTGQAIVLSVRWDAFWSVLCPIDGEIELLIDDPRLPATMMEAPDLRLRVTADELYAPERQVMLSPGQALLLPGWLRIGCTAASPAVLGRLSFVAPSEGSRS